MSTATVVRQSKQHSSVWTMVRRRGPGYFSTTVPRADVHGQKRERGRLHFVSNEAFVRSLARPSAVRRGGEWRRRPAPRP